MLSKKALLKELKLLCDLPGISGREEKVASYLMAELNKLSLKGEVDNLGNVIVRYPSRTKIFKKDKVLICAHMDEVGFMVMDIYQSGLIKASCIGGMNTDELGSKRVKLINSDNQEFHGVINAVAPHLRSEGGSDELYFDFGFSSKEEALTKNIKRFDAIVFDEPFRIINEKRILSKALDDRYGCALALSLLKDLVSKHIELPYELYVSFSVQEEVGSRGVGPIVHQVKPDICIILDASPSRDALNKEDGQGALDKGVLIRYLDRGQIFYKPLLDFQIEMCKKSKVPYQMYNSLGGTDGGVAHKHLDGVFTFVHGIALRNIHGPSTLASVQDYLGAYKVLHRMINSIKPEFIIHLKNGGIDRV